jgi:serine/threonine protein kinase/Tfp pilus assembly protein PilF
MEPLVTRKFCETCGSSVDFDMPSGFCPACLLTTALESSEVAAAGSHIEDYELLNEIARGGMGIVYRARQRVPSRMVALKMILPAHLNSPGAVHRFRSEAEAAASLDHEHILPIYAVGEYDGAPFYSMKFAEGGTLAARIDDFLAKPREAAVLIGKLARAVAFAHEHGILHRDLKPGNVLFDSVNKPYVSDFGLAKWLQRECDLTQTLAILGTPYYMAPEQATDSRGVTAAADVYSLGAILYHLLTGRPPFAGDTPMEVLHRAEKESPKPPRLTNQHVPRDLETICLKCLAKEPATRYASAAALAEDLERWLKHQPIQAKRSGFVTQGRKWVRRNPTTAVLAALLIALAASVSFTVWNRRPAVIIPKSVAVLPFENLSNDANNAYFADGIQEEILTRLAGIADLKVISRTSTQQYQSKSRNLSQIAKQLGVANILEGSVQKAADQVRVNVQLINAQTDSHLWAETYDRKLTDVLGVESEIAKSVAESLQARLNGREEHALAVKPTKNPEAYDAYLRGLAFEARSYRYTYPDLWRKAVDCYQRAAELDPNFASAWSRLSGLNAHLYFSNSVETNSAARGDAAKRALENAQKLAPDSSETLLALGYYQYWVLRDYPAAKTTFARVSKLLPGNSEVPRALALIAEHEGHWDESVDNFERALSLDPRNVELLNQAAGIYDMLRQFPAALKLFNRAWDITPNDPDAIVIKAGIYQAQGNLQEAAKLLTEVNAQTPTGPAFNIKIIQLRLERNYDEAIRLLQARLAQFHFDSQYEKSEVEVDLALTQRLAGDLADAKLTAEQARNTLEQIYKDQPNNYRVAPPLSEAYAVMGEKDMALQAAERAITLMPRAKDAVFAPSFEENLALIQMIVGEESRTISILSQLLQTPYDSLIYYTAITPALLRLDPYWDSLRADPAFQKLCEEKQP